jgi:hypothetical protein
MKGNDLNELIGKKFKYLSPVTGLSDWEDTITSIGKTYRSQFPDKGYRLKFYVYGKARYNSYELENVVII